MKTSGTERYSEVLLIRSADPSMAAFSGIGASQHPVNLLALATYLNENGFRASVYDLQVQGAGGLLERITARPPLLAGISFMTPGIGPAAETIALLRARGIKVAAGGAHATALPAETLADTGADFVVAGEGEGPLLALAAALASGGGWENIPGLAFMRDGRPVVNPRTEPLPIDSLPIPDRRLLELGLYTGHTTPGVPAGGAVMFTSRGCPYDCGFCASSVVSGGRLRLRSLDLVMREVEHLVGLGFRHITVDDDTLTAVRDRALEFCRRLLAGGYGVTWNCDSRVDTMDRELMQAMKESGCIKVAFGVESGSQRILDSMGKRITVEQALECFRLAREAGVQSQAFFMIGHPEETEEDLAATERLIRELRPDLLSLTIAAPLPGTGYHERMSREGWLPPGGWKECSFFADKPAWRTRHFTGGRLAAERRRISRAFYFSPGFVLRRLAALRRPGDLAYLLKGAAAALRAFVLR